MQPATRARGRSEIVRYLAARADPPATVRSAGYQTKMAAGPGDFFALHTTDATNYLKRGAHSLPFTETQFAKEKSAISSDSDFLPPPLFPRIKKAFFSLTDLKDLSL